MIFTKGAHQSGKFQKNFDCWGEISSNLYFDRLFCKKYIKFQLKKYWGVVPWYWRSMQNLKKNRFVVSKMARIWWILIRALKVSKICTLIGPFPAKYITFDLKVQRSYLSWPWRVWSKTGLWFGKWHEEFSIFSPEHLKKFAL